MSAEGAVSVGAPGVGLATAGMSSPGIGASMSSEMGTTGIGFDSGSPTFSGLGRSDAGLGSFSINEGSIGPVSFSNSTDLFSETRPFVSSIGSIPEGPVKGNIFSSDMATLASNPNTEAKQPSIFTETSPFQITMPVNEGPVPSFSLKETVEIESLKSEPISIQPILEISVQPEINVESAVETFIATEEFIDASSETVRGALEDLKTNDPFTYMQLRSDLESVGKIVDIVDEIADPETAAVISNSAISSAVDRSGIIESIQVQEEPEAESDVQQATPTEKYELIKVKETVPDTPVVKYFVDEDANSAREKDTSIAIKQTFEEDIDPITGKVKGKDVVGHLTPEPPEEEISELVLQEGGKIDGSEAQRRSQLSLMEFESIEEALAANESLIAENNAVTHKETSKRATYAEAAKVRSGNKPTISENQIFPLVA